MNSSIPVICCTWVIVVTCVILANIGQYRNPRFTIVISVISILLTGCLSVLYFACDHRREPMKSENFLAPGIKYVTLTQSPESCKSLGKFPENGDPFDDNTVGLIHARMCLENLIILARKTNRTAILPPPWVYLSRWHNNGKYIDENVWWDRYYSLDEFIDAGDIASKELLIHDAKKQRGKILIDCEYVEPDTSHHIIKKSSTPLITMHCYEGWGGNKENQGWTCGGVEFGGGIGHGWQRSLVDLSFKPSNLVSDTAAKIKDELGGEFVLVHVRRGDSLIIDNYWGISQKDMHKITSADYIAEFLQEHDIDTKTHVLIMTNETDINHFSKLKNSYSNTKLEAELIALKEIVKLDDNFLTYEIMRKVASEAKTRISTAPCYFDAKCEFALGDAISTMITHESAAGTRS